MRVYKDGFDDWNDVRTQFAGEQWGYDANPPLVGPETEPDFVFASYTCECYEGDATVAYYLDGKFHLNEGSHCSCYGLEGQWDPDEYEPETFRAMVERLEKGEYSYGLAKYKDELQALYEAVMEPKLL